MSKTIIVSNRLPLQISIKHEIINVSPSVGGLATGLQSLHREGNGYWVGWTGLSEEDLPCEFKRKEISRITQEKRCVPVSLSNEEVKQFYQKFSNETIWPLYHYFTEYAHFEENSWEFYKNVNKKFADKVLEIAAPNDTIWVHDYQLMLVPQLLKEKNPNLTIGFFLHIPFPSYEVFRLLPYRKEILLGMLGADLLGFHTVNYKKHFISTAKALIECEVNDQAIVYKEKLTKIDSFPMGIDYEKFESAALKHKNQTPKQASSLQKELDQFKATHENIKLIISIDRLDYTKGMACRIRAFEYFLDHYPQYRNKVSLVMLAVPSRTKVPQYKDLKKEIDQLVGHVNGKFGGINWTPIWYFYRSMPFKNLIDLYTNCDIALITPLRDGMNLVAKEYIATRIDQKGVLILSEMAGAAEELIDSLLINPNNYEEIAFALAMAMEMSDEEQIRRNTILQTRLKEYTVQKWADDFMTKLKKIKNLDLTSPTINVDSNIFNTLLEKYNNSRNRVIFLDYDGTLVGFNNNPQEVIPDKELLEIIRSLVEDSKNEVVIISGRDKSTMSKWWKKMPVSIIAEHGLFSRNKEGIWTSSVEIDNSWKSHFLSIMEVYVEKLPESFIEIKDNSVVWHYRAVGSTEGERAAKELKSLLLNFVDKYNLSVLEGKKNIEIKSKYVNKGLGVMNHLIDKHDYWVIAIGDDETDENMFENIPSTGISIKVGKGKTKAHYRMEDFREVRNFLLQLASGHQVMHLPSTNGIYKYKIKAKK